MRHFFLLVLIALVCIPFGVRADTVTSSGFVIKDSVFTNGGSKNQSASFGLGQSIGQSIIGRSLSSSFQVWSGFQYFATADPFVLTATPGSKDTSLSWTAPVVHTGAFISSYEVGIGTVSGSYVFSSVSNFRSYLQSGLLPSTRYYFIVKALSSSGTILSFSNEVSVVTLAETIPPPGGGGGGGVTPVGDSDVVVAGIAYPGARVSILIDGTFQASTVSDPGAQFRITIKALKAGSYVLSVYAEDAEGRKSSSYSIPIVLAKSVTAEVNNIFLAPTIGVSNHSVKQGEPINIFGTAAPNVQVNIYVHSAKEFIEKVTTTASGVWFKQFDTSFLEIGKHETFSRAHANDRVTDESQIVQFSVGGENLPLSKDMRSDLNNDLHVNIIDFSMLLYWWQKIPPTTSKADINKDGRVDTVDLSIMLYDWTG